VSESLSITPDNVALVVSAALSAIKESATSADLKKAKTEHTGEHSALSALNATLRDVPSDQKAAAGKMMGEAKASVLRALQGREQELVAHEEGEKLQAEALDMTALGAGRPLGARHPLSVLMEDMADVFVSMGWEVAEGPELEHEWLTLTP